MAYLYYFKVVSLLLTEGPAQGANYAVEGNYEVCLAH